MLSIDWYAASQNYEDTSLPKYARHPLIIRINEEEGTLPLTL